MKIIDFEKKGNQVKFYLGDDNLKDWGEESWDEPPYYFQNEIVDEQFVKATVIITFDFEDVVMEPSEGDVCYNEWSKNDMVDRAVPCIIVLPKKYRNRSNCHYPDFDRISQNFEKNSQHEKCIRFYFGDKLDPNIYNKTKTEDLKHE